jgi:microcystin-dependent protein
MSGTLNIALAQQLDVNGVPLAGALLYFFQVGSVATPQNSYQDYGLTIPNPNPLEADQYGRIPMFYLADGQTHVRLTDANGVVIFDYPTMQVIGPSSGGNGGGGSVDPTTIASSGDFKWRPTSEVLTGWVKANGTTIGNAASGASQRANADTQSLFVYLWSNFTDAHCPVSGGRGASGLADYNAGLTITLPDLRGRVPAGLDNMGASASGRLVSQNITSAGDGVTTPAATGGEGAHTLVLTEAPNGQYTFNDPGHYHNYTYYTYSFLSQNIVEGGAPVIVNCLTGETLNTGTANTSDVVTGASITDHAGGQAHNNAQPLMLGTWFIKL